MDSKGDEMRHQMDDTMAGLTDKLEDLGDQVAGTVSSVKKSMNSVKDAFDVKYQVRRHPLTALAGATALGFLWSVRSNGSTTRDNRNSIGPVARADPSAGANDDTNGADDGYSPTAAAPSRLASLRETFKPEITALRGVAVGALLGVVREAIMKQAAKPTARSARDASVSGGTSANQEKTKR